MVNRRRHKKKEEGNSERWMVTYLDMITLLLLFFIVLYTLSKVDVAKFETLAESLSAVFGAGGMVLDSPGPEVIPGSPPDEIRDVVEQDEQIKEQLELAQLSSLKKKLEEYIEESGLASRVSVRMEERGIVLSFQEAVLFKLGSAQLTPQAYQILTKLTPLMVNIPNYIRIEGHTDDLPIRTSRYPSNWELSAARSTNVLQAMINDFGFTPQKMSATAYGQYRPRVANSNMENRQLNRRVDLVILRSKFAEVEPNNIPNSTETN